MKFIAIYIAVIVYLVGLANAIICATDNKSGGPQNFISRIAMEEENERGGGKYLKPKKESSFRLNFCIFLAFKIIFSNIMDLAIHLTIQLTDPLDVIEMNNPDDEM